MDTSVITSEPQELHQELLKASEKADKLYNRAITNTGFGATVGGLAITKTYLSKVTEVITKKLDGPRPRSDNLQFHLERMVRQLQVDHLALCVLQSGLHCVAVEENTHAEAVLHMGSALADECWAANLMQTDRKVANRISKQVKGRFTSTALRKQAAKKAAADAGYAMAEWSKPMLAHAGQWVMNILLEAMPDVFELSDLVWRRGKSQREWTITDAGLALADEAVAEAVVRSPVYQPRTERPTDWTGFYARVAEDCRSVATATILRTAYKDTVAAARHAIRRDNQDENPATI
jgi:hypothetical protein